MAKLLYDEHVTQDHEVLCICTENKVPIGFLLIFTVNTYKFYGGIIQKYVSHKARFPNWINFFENTK